jgi:GNAT superfamily N-acetyltransferase
MIRELKAEDMQYLRPLLEEIHSKSDYRRFKPHWPTVFAVIARLSVAGAGWVRVTENRGKLTGIFLGMIDEYWWAEPGRGARYATDLLVYSKYRGEGFKMLEEFKAWAWDRPRVVRVETAVSSGIAHKTLAANYDKIGLLFHGPMFAANHPKLSEV